MLKAIHQNGGYYFGTKNICNKDLTLVMKFDTGAVHTVISLEALTMLRVDKEKFVENIKNRTVHRKFKSASGNTMIGYLVLARDVLLSNTRVDEFYYYLIVNVEDSVGLLGDDFISKCTFHHNKDGDIEIEAFDNETYHNDMQCVSRQEVDELLELCAIDSV